MDDVALQKQGVISPQNLAAVSVEQFFACELRVGTVLACELNPRARKPSFVLTIDFGPLGLRTSSAQLVVLYSPETLIARQVIAVVNFPARNVAGVESQCLVLGIETPEGVVLLGVERPVPNGSRVS
ncbi:MAG: tRNA-binding protein [Chlorobi bacterium]|nr:tRNA-binding protein [Chlorobiota bacterium]MBX7215480.1 tRNA-binding protein [Candidatus Kapabacteria bacterium]